MQNKLINIAFRWSSTVLLLSLVFLLVACKKYLEPEFKTQILTSDIFANDQNAQSAINGLYINMATVYSSFNVNVTRLGGFASDELTYLNQSDFDNQFMNNQINTTNSSVKSFWDDFYKIIYQCNSIIENSKASTGMSPSYKKQIIGEAMFFRAFSHFYLVNFFGPVPAITSTDKNITAYLPRTSVDSVYTQIKTDLIGAMDSLRADYSISGGIG